MNDVAGALRRYQYDFGTEKALQDDVERVLVAEGIAFDRECRLTGGPIDFLTRDGVGIECKIAGGYAAVLAQLLRYAGNSRLRSLILVTSRPTHQFDQAELCGKPFGIVWVAGQL